MWDGNLNRLPIQLNWVKLGLMSMEKLGLFFSRCLRGVFKWLWRDVGGSGLSGCNGLFGFVFSMYYFVFGDCAWGCLKEGVI